MNARQPAAYRAVYSHKRTGPERRAEARPYSRLNRLFTVIPKTPPAEHGEFLRRNGKARQGKRQFHRQQIGREDEIGRSVGSQRSPSKNPHGSERSRIPLCMTVGEWLSTVICGAEHGESEGLRSAHRTERSYERRDFYSGKPTSNHRHDRRPREQQADERIDYEERSDGHERERRAGRRPFDRGAPRHSPMSEHSWEYAFGDDALSVTNHRQMPPRRRSKAAKERWTESVKDEAERDRGRYDDLPTPPQSSGLFRKFRELIGGLGKKNSRDYRRDEPQQQNAHEDQRDRHGSRLRLAASRPRDEQWLEYWGAEEDDLPRDGYAHPRRRGPKNEISDWRDWRRRDAAPQRARDEDWIDWIESFHSASADRDIERYREPRQPRRNEQESWRNLRGEPRRHYGRARNRDRDEDRYEDLNAPAARYYDIQRSNFDHELDRAPRPHTFV
jgi:hypothetical protein